MRVRAVGLVALLGLLVSCSSGGDDATEEASPSTTTAPAATTTTGVPAVSEPLPVTDELVDDLPGYRIWRPVDLDATGAPMPVIVWANGGCVRHDETWRPLLEGLAAGGYVVVAITAPADGSDPTAAGATSAEDQAAAIDWAEAQDDAGGPYAGHLDLDRVVAAGNSCGGITSLALAGSDDRVRSVFVLSGSSVGPGASRESAEAVMADVTVPVGFVVGSPEEDIAAPQALQDYEVLPDGVPGLVVNRSEGDHVVVSTTPAILEDAAQIGVNWLDLTLFGDAAAADALAGVPCDCPPDTWTVTSKHLDTLVT